MTEAIAWPPICSTDELRRRYADLRDFDDKALGRHYEVTGRMEGRIASAAALRKNFLRLIPDDASVLEIGPFCNPALTGANVRYLDVLDSDGLRAQAETLGLDTSRCPETIHFTRGLQEAAGQDFDLLFASHNLEHQPDLIGHLKQAAAALRPGGSYMLILPDRRFCFDHFLPDFTLPRLLDAHLEGRTVHTAQSVIEHRGFTCHNDSLRHWHGDHGPAPDGKDGRVDLAIAQLEAAQGGYIDVHAWQFTPESFRTMLSTLHALGWSPLRPHRVYDTPYGLSEFTAVLTLDASQ